MRTAGRTCSSYKNGRKKRPNGWMGNISPMKQVNGGSDASFIQYLQLFKLFLSTFFVSVCFRISRAETNCTQLLNCIFLFKNRQGHWHCSNNRYLSPFNSGVWEPDDCCITFYVIMKHTSCNLDVLVSILNANKTTPRFQLLVYRFVVSGKVKSAQFNTNLPYIQ